MGAVVKGALAMTLVLAGTVAAWASIPNRRADAGSAGQKYVDELARVRDQVMTLENGLVSSLKTDKEARANLRKLQSLIALERQEKEIGERRMKELEDTVRELELRRESLNEGIVSQQHEARRLLIAIGSSARAVGWEVEAPRRKLLANLTSRALRELEILKADLSDADRLQSRIQDEKQQLAYLFQELNERESVLELNRQLQVDLLKKNHAERIAQLESYSRLKASQAQVESMISEFNARRELEKAQESERIANRSSEFERLKGKLSLPVLGGRVVSSFGRSFDPRSKLYIFKKGVDIQAGAQQEVKAIFPGKVAYSGELPEYGRVAIIDHGDHFYSLCAHLGEISKKTGDPVVAGDAIGLTDDTGVVYFEIRSRNVAVNPLQWVSDSISLGSTR